MCVVRESRFFRRNTVIANINFARGIISGKYKNDARLDSGFFPELRRLTSNFIAYFCRDPLAIEESRLRHVRCPPVRQRYSAPILILQSPAQTDRSQFLQHPEAAPVHVSGRTSET